MADLTDEELARGAELAAKSWTGAWRYTPTAEMVDCPEGSIADVLAIKRDRAVIGEFIAWCGTHAPSLLAEVARLRAMNAELIDASGMACECPPPDCDCAGCSYAREAHRAADGQGGER